MFSTTSKVLLAVIFLIVSSSFAQESCSIDYSGHWPLGFIESDLTWAPNAKEDRTGPKYRLFSEKDVRHVLPNTQYNFDLEILNKDTSNIKTFLITVSPTSLINTKQNCLQEGRLQSLSDDTEHLTYDCYRYLVSRKPPTAKGGKTAAANTDGGVQKIPFAWKTPKCGCFMINIEILDQNNKIFTYEDDEFDTLSIKSCVKKAQKVEKVLKKRIQKKNRKHQRRRGKKFCCKKGNVTRFGKIRGTCNKPQSGILDKALEQFGLDKDLCMEMFQSCCQDKLTGFQRMQDMKNKVRSSKSKFKQMRQKLKEKKNGKSKFSNV